MTNDPHKKERDAFSGVETTGHDWDGLKELNNPLPRWWLILFIVCIIYAVGYWVVYPAWPTLEGHTKGKFGWTQYTQLKEQQAEITAMQNKYADRFDAASLDQIKNDPELYNFALAGGAVAFKNNCAACHGSGAQGGNGYPNLNDDDWLWGGSIDQINATIRYGVRSGHPKMHDTTMPSYGKDGILKAEEIEAAADYVLALHDPAVANPKTQEVGTKVFADNCAACHGDKGQGNIEMGAPSLADSIWLYSGKREDIVAQMNSPRLGVMPTWEGRLPERTIKQLVLYVHSLSGGK